MPPASRVNRHACEETLILAACALCCGNSLARDRVEPGPFHAKPSSDCAAQEDSFRALKLTRTGDSIRVDYQFIAGNQPRWANMNADLVRRLNVRVGQTFCMSRDTGSAESAPTDFD